MNQVKFKKIIWTDLVNPTREELEVLQKRYRFHDLDIEDTLSIHERPKIEAHSKHLFLIFKLPRFNKRTRLIEIAELNLFMGSNFVITSHEGKIKLLNQIFEDAKGSLVSRKRLFSEGTGKFLWELLKTLFRDIFPMVDRMSKELRRMERDVFESKVLRNQLKDILIFKRNLITLRRILIPQRAVIESIEALKMQFLPDNLEIFFDDILDKIEKLIESTTSLQDLVDSLRDTNETMLTHSLNNTIRVLTIFSAILLPLTFVTGFYGMNIALPYQDYPNIHLWIIGGMTLLSVFMLVFFKWRKWV